MNDASLAGKLEQIADLEAAQHHGVTADILRQAATRLKSLSRASTELERLNEHLRRERDEARDNPGAF